MITKTFTNVAIAVLTAGALAACGSTSNRGANNTQAAQAVQICVQGSASKPGYPLPINKLDGGANTLSGAGSTFVAPFLERAQLIVLAGGDVRLGWNTFEKTGMKDVILDRHAQGAVLVGISAGAVQLGRYGIVETPESPTTELLNAFKLVPVVIDTHDELAEWARLSRTIHLLEGAAAGLGIPSGGGVIVHADTTIEPLRRPAHEFRFEGTRVTHSLLCAEKGN